MTKASLRPLDPRASISVAMCTYNGERYLREQLESIAAQAAPPAELVVCDDASNDGTMRILEEFAREAPFPVRITANATNLGLVKNFEQAISLCSGELIALSDQDDVWLPAKLQRLAEVMSATPAPAFAFCDAELIDGESRRIGGRTLMERRFAPRSMRRAFAEGRAIELMIKRDFIYGTTLVFRADRRPLVLPIPETWSHDTWVVNVLTFLGYRGVPLLEPLVLYRQHGGQHSGGMGAPRVTKYGQRIAACEELYAHLVAISDREAVSCVPGGLQLIEEKLAYLRALDQMAHESKVGRAAIALREVLSGRWWRFTPRTFR